MSDCAIAIANAVDHVYLDRGPKAPKHYWCLFHILGLDLCEASNGSDELWRTPTGVHDWKQHNNTPKAVPGVLF